MEIKISEIDGYSNWTFDFNDDYARSTTLDAVKGLNMEQLDYVVNEKSNSIGALLLHMAAVETGFQIEIFDGRRPNESEMDKWGAAYVLGDLGRTEIKGNHLEFYVERLNEVRNRTLEELKQRDDKWLYEERLWGDVSSNNYFIWFHVFEDELNHRGQIRILRKMLPF
ncbi:DinB family protein [Virgibacillus oceani]|uniref:Integrase n=1 Tax=Virgibacillus oceani TaxID=1479511 RepID=A0A917M763_9BACI|nr:DinB family protein [Virgibacillus oceani]GGG83454.1 integrase [Virgibacillus oceani]